MMLNEDINTIKARMYYALHWQLAGQMPRKGGVHIYSTNNMYEHFVTDYGGFKMTMSQGVPYSAMAMGFNEDGSRRIARISETGLEAMNYQTIEKCVLSVCRSIAIPRGGKVVNKL